MHVFIIKGRLRHGLAGVVLSGALAFAGCAATGPKDMKGADTQAESVEGKKPEEARKIVESISVVGEGDRVLISTTTAVRYTVFKLTDPARLVVDMPGVGLEKITSPVKVDNDYLREITAITYGGEEKIGRVVIGLKEGVEHEIKSGENSILVSLKKNEPAAVETPKAEATAAEPAKEEVKAAAESAAEVETPKAEAEAPAPGVPEEVKAEESVPAKTATPESRPASKIVKIEKGKGNSDTVIRVVADGEIGNYNSFVLDKPSRVIVDVWKVANSTGRAAVKVNDKLVKDVRIGVHADDKVRLVFDTAGKKLPPYQIQKEGGILVVTFGSSAKAVAASAKESAAAPLAASAEKSEAPVQVAATAPEGPANPADEVKDTAPVAVPEKKESPIEPAPMPEARPEVKEEVKAEAKAEEKSVEIEKVEFKKTEGKGRLTIAASAKAEFSVKEAEDGKTIAVDIKGAVIKEELVRTLDATRLKTPVVSVSSYQESMRPKDVRVLVKLADKTSYDVKEDNGVLTIVFAQPVEAAAVKAAEAATAKEETASEASAKEYTGRRIDLDMVEANVSDVLRLIAEVSNLNIIASDDVKGTISLRLKNVPWDQAFDIILKSKDLDKVREGNVIRVAPSSKLRQEKDAALTAKKAIEKLEPLEIKFLPVNYAKASELENQIKGVLSERGSVTSEARTNTLIIKDIQKGIDSAVNLVTKLDTTIPQVLIEARIVEAESTFARDLGIQWGIDYRSNNSNSMSNVFGASGTAGQTPPNTAPISPSVITPVPPVFDQTHGAQNFAVNLPAAGSSAHIGTLGALGFVFGKTGQNPFVLDLRLSAGEQEGKLKTISRPRITTLDNKEAKIEQGESLPFETTSASGTQTTFIDANLSLTVTPHITPDGSVLMKIKASNNQPGNITTASGARSISKKESSTEVLVRDGETTVIGGIVISKGEQTDSGIPYLKDIPVLGWFFRSKFVFDQQKELLIFITPTIIRDKGKAVG